MYDILQLNDMLVPELLDIAEQLKIPNAKKLSKQELVYKILDSQAIAGSKGAKPSEDGKRKRIVKTTTSIGSEEAEVESGDEEKSIIKKPNMPVKKDLPAARQAKPVPVKKVRKKAADEEVMDMPVVNEEESSEDNSDVAAIIAEAAQPAAESTALGGAPKVYPPRREQQFNVEFDGVILSEGVLEMMPDGYGFLRSSDYNYLSSPDDVYVSPSQIKLFGLKPGIRYMALFAPQKKAKNISHC